MRVNLKTKRFVREQRAICQHYFVLKKKHKMMARNKPYFLKSGYIPILMSIEYNVNEN
jgi:hypothetical protein